MSKIIWGTWQPSQRMDAESSCWYVYGRTQARYLACNSAFPTTNVEGSHWSGADAWWTTHETLVLSTNNGSYSSWSFHHGLNDKANASHSNPRPVLEWNATMPRIGPLLWLQRAIHTKPLLLDTAIAHARWYRRDHGCLKSSPYSGWPQTRDCDAWLNRVVCPIDFIVWWSHSSTVAQHIILLVMDGHHT